MSEQNVETIRSVFEPLRGANLAAIDWDIEAMREIVGAGYSECYVENLDYVDAGACVLVPSRQWGVGAGSGAAAELKLTTLYELRDGLIVRVHQYDTLAEAQADAAS